MAKQPEYIAILSAEKNDLGCKDNAIRTADLEKYLNDRFPYKKVLGYYNKIAEKSFIIVLEGPKDEREILELAENYDQNYVLFSDEDRKAWLTDVETGGRTDLGYLRKVPKNIALKQDSCTFDPLTNSYWSTTK